MRLINIMSAVCIITSKITQTLMAFTSCQHVSTNTHRGGSTQQAGGHGVAGPRVRKNTDSVRQTIHYRSLKTQQLQPSTYQEFDQRSVPREALTRHEEGEFLTQVWLLQGAGACTSCSDSVAMSVHYKQQLLRPCCHVAHYKHQLNIFRLAT